jgi:predicted nuclease of predicted toxin-antitoxin system
MTMRAKLDENLELGLAIPLRHGGNDVETVLSEGYSGRSDEAIYEACLRERRTLFTLDLDFANPVRFPPSPTEGIVVIRPPRPVLPLIRVTLLAALPQLKDLTLTGRLWIVEPGRIRVYQPDGEDPDQPLDR